MNDSDTCQSCGLATPAGLLHNGWDCMLEMQRREETQSVPAPPTPRGFRLFGQRFVLANVQEFGKRFTGMAHAKRV